MVEKGIKKLENKTDVSLVSHLLYYLGYFTPTQINEYTFLSNSKITLGGAVCFTLYPPFRFVRYCCLLSDFTLKPFIPQPI